MSDNALIEKLLDLPEFEVTDVKQNENDIWIFVRKKERPDFCERCFTCNPRLHVKEHKRNIKCIAGAEKVDLKQTVRHLNILGKRTGLIIDRIKYKCLDCGHSFWEPISCIEPRGRMTKKLRDFIAEEAKHSSFADIERDLDISDTTVKKIFSAEVDKLPPYNQTETPTVLGIDEIFVRRPDHNSRKEAWAIICNGDKHTAMELLPNRLETTIIDFLLGLKNPENVRVVTMDMCKAYRYAIRKVLPHAAIVVDKPHVERMPGAARKETLRYLNNADLDLDELLFLRKEARRLTNTFFRIYDCGTRAEAIACFEEWSQSIPKSKHFAEFKKMARTIKRWHTEIFNYFDYQYTNSFVERMNLTIRRLDLHSYGLTYKAMRGKILFYTPIVFEKPHSKFGTTHVENIFFAGPLCYGVSFNEIDRAIQEGRF